MKAILASLWKRRWCRSLLWVALAFGIVCLHPFVRQTIFGPKIDGIPWFVWENQARASANRDTQKKAWLYEFLEKIGLIRHDGGGMDMHAEAAMPLHVQLADDSDVHVRQFALNMLLGGGPQDRPRTLQVLQRHLTDSDPSCRALAARGAWRRTEDPALLPIVLPLVDHADRDVRFVAILTLCDMAPRIPETFEPLAKLSEDPDRFTRNFALSAMPSFGKRAIPVFRKALNDSDREIRRAAIINISVLRKNAAELIPDLLALQSDPSPDVRQSVAEVLPLIDPKRVPAPAKAGQ